MTKFKDNIIGRILADARHPQLIIQASLLILLVVWSDFAPRLDAVIFTICAAIITQFIFFKIFKIPSNDYRSPLATSISLSLLFKANIIWLFPLVGAVAIASKFLIRWQGKHVFNPSAVAIVLGLIIFPNNVWVSPGQWGSALLLGFTLLCLAAVVLNRSKSSDIAFFFLGGWFFLNFARAIWLGDPLSIPIHNIQSGTLLIFAFFMLSDPMTIPNKRLGRLIFALAVAGLAFLLQYGFQIREALFYALVGISMTTPLLDYFFKGHRHRWKTSEGKTS